MTTWKSLAKHHHGKNVLVAVHIGYGRDNLATSLQEDINIIQRLKTPVIEVSESRWYLENGAHVITFPHEDELKGQCFGIIYLCGSQRESCIPRMEACLRNFSKRIIRLEALIH